MRDSIRLRRGKLSDWNRINPVLDKAEIGIVFSDDATILNPVGFKVGNGLEAFSALPFSDFGLIPKLTSDLVNNGEDGSSPYATQQWVLDNEIEGKVESISVNSGSKFLPDEEKNINLSITKATVGLENVENYSPADMPISTATQNALDAIIADVDAIESYIPNDTTVNNQLVNEGRLVGYSMPITTKYGASVSLNYAPATGILTLQLKDQDNNTLGASQSVLVDLPHLVEQIDSILALIPTQATPENKLADKEFVNSSISTNTANFIGTFEDVPALIAYTGAVTNNDYAFVLNSERDFLTLADLQAFDKSLLTNYDYGWVANGNKFDLYRFDIVNQEWILKVSHTDKEAVTLNSAYNRYKATIEQSTVWAFEYTLNNSSFTAAQWASINSGITSEAVDNYNAHIANTSNPHSVTKSQVGLGNVDNVQQYSAANPNFGSVNPLMDGTASVGSATTYAHSDHIHPSDTTKVDKTTIADKVYGTDSNGNQTTYDKDSFGQVEDVQLDGVSIVEDKVANIPVAAESDIVDIFATEGITYALYPTGNEYIVSDISNVEGKVIIPKSENEELPVSRFSAIVGPYSRWNRVILPDSIKVIEGSFSQSNLSYVNLDKVESIIGDGIKDTKIKSVNLSSMNYLTSSAFANNKDLTEIVFGKYLSNIPNNCFDGCSSISKLSIPSSVSFIGSKAFGSTTGPMNLKEIIFEHTNSDSLEITSGAFETKSNYTPSSVNVYYYGNQAVYDYFRGSESFPHTVDNMNILSLTDLSSQGD